MPGSSVCGETIVAQIWSPRTSSVVRFSRMAMRMESRVLDERPGDLVVTLEVDHGVGGQFPAVAVDLGCRCADRSQLRVREEGADRGDLRPGGTADAPGLLEHTGAAGALVVVALRDVVVAARGEHAVEAGK